MSSPLRSVLAEFGIKFDHGEVHKAEHGVTGLIETLKRVGSIAAEAFIVREVYEFTERIVESAVALEHLSVKTGIATDELQGLEYAAKLSGVGAEELDTALGRLGKTLAAAKGAKIEGIDTKDLNGTRSAAAFLPDVADKFLTLTNTSDRAALAIKLFGRAGVQLVPLLAKGSEGIKELTEEAKSLGGGLSKEAIESSVKLEEATKRLDFAFTGLKGTIAESIFPELAELATGAAHLVKEFRDWVKTTKLIEAAVIGFTGRAVLTLLRHVGGLTGAFKLLRGAIFRTILPMLALEDVIVFLAGGKSEIGKLVDKIFGKGSQEKVRAFISDVIKRVEDFFAKVKAIISGGAEGPRPLWETFFGKSALTDWAQFWTDLLVDPTNFGSKLQAALRHLLTGGANDTTSPTGPKAPPPTKVDEAVHDTLDKLPGAKAFRDRFGPGRKIDADYRRFKGLPAREDAHAPTVQGESTSLLDKIPFLKGIKDKFGPGAALADQFKKAKEAQALRDSSAQGADATAPLASTVVTAPIEQQTSNVTNNITVKNDQKINVVVPSGTPESEARGVGRAAAQGSKIDLGAAKAALVPTAG